MRILLAEGDSTLASFVRKGLEAEHYAVDICADGPETAFLSQQFGYDLMVLDLNLNVGRTYKAGVASYLRIPAIARWASSASMTGVRPFRKVLKPKGVGA